MLTTIRTILLMFATVTAATFSAACDGPEFENDSLADAGDDDDDDDDDSDDDDEVEDRSYYSEPMGTIMCLYHFPGTPEEVDQCKACSIKTRSHCTLLDKGPSTPGCALVQCGSPEP